MPQINTSPTASTTKQFFVVVRIYNENAYYDDYPISEKNNAIYEKSGSTNDLKNIFKNFTAFRNKNVKTLTKNNNKEEIKMLSPKKQINDLRKNIGFNISEIAAILHVQRPTIYGWLESNRAMPRKINQKRLNEIYNICEKWFQKNLEHINCYLDRPIHNGQSLLDLLTKKNLNSKIIYAAFEQLEKIIKEDDSDLEQHNNFIKKHGLEERVKLHRERVRKTHRGIG